MSTLTIRLMAKNEKKITIFVNKTSSTKPVAYVSDLNTQSARKIYKCRYMAASMNSARFTA